MRDNVKNILGISLAVSSVVFAISMSVLAGAFFKAKETIRNFAVSAEGKVLAIPEVAEFTFTVITEGGRDLIALQEENSRKSSAVTAYLKEQGVSDQDIKTINYSISPRYQNFSCPSQEMVCPPSEIVGYAITHSSKVKVRDLAKVGEILSGVISSGANSASSLSFSIDDMEKLQSQARDIALQKAREKAQEIAGSAGVRLGKIVSINEGFYPFFDGRDAGEKLFSLETAQASLPAIEPGSQEIRVLVNIVYEIK